MSAYTVKVHPRTLRSGLSALGSGSRSLIAIYEQCHKLLLVLGVDLAQTRSYSRRWQVARIGLCGRGAVSRHAEKFKLSISDMHQRPLTL